MACPFLEDAIDEEAALLRRELHTRQKIILRPWSTCAVIFFELSLQNLMHVTNVTHCGCTPTSAQMCCVAVHLQWSFYYTTSNNAKLNSEGTDCRAIRDIVSLFKVTAPRATR